MAKRAVELTRRTFLKFASAVGFLGLSGVILKNGESAASAKKTVNKQNVLTLGGALVYKRSNRNKNGVSEATKHHNANRLYRTQAAALSDPAHKGDKSIVKSTTIPRKWFEVLFAGGKDIVDLRRDLTP